MKHGTVRKQLLMGAMALLGSGTGLGVIASVAGASVDPPAMNSNVEVCKASVAGTLGVTGSFGFSITNTVNASQSHITVAVGTCSGPIAVAGTSSVVTEDSSTAYKVTAIAVPAGGVIPSTNTSYLTSSSLTGQMATLALAQNLTDTVTFTNSIVPGFVEVCKNAATGSGLTGNFLFNVTGGGWLNGGPASANLPPISVAVGNCSLPIEMPAGTVTSTEAGTNLYVTSLTANFGATTTSAVVGSPNLVTGTVTATVKAAADASIQTDINYTDNVVAFKVCKVFDSVNGPQPSANQLYPFTFSVAATSVAGPNTAPAAVSIPAGSCSTVTTFRAGTTLTVTENVVPGTKVESITDADAVNGSTAESILNTGTATAPVLATNVVTRSVTYVLGTPITATQTVPGNEVASTFTDVAAAPGVLKVCKLPGAITPAGGPFTISYSGTAYAVVASTGVIVGQVVPVSGTVSVVLNGCVIISEPSAVAGVSVPVPFLYNSAVSLSETASAYNVLTGVVAGGAGVVVNGTSLTNGLGSTPFLTGQPMVSNVVLNSASNAIAGTATATISEGNGNITEVDFINSDPPDAITTPTPVISTGGGIVVTTPVVSTGSSTTSTGSTVGNGITASTSSSNNTVTSPLTIPTIASVGGNTVVTHLTAAQKKALLKAYNKTLSNVKAAIVRENKLISHATGKARTADIKRLHVLQSEQKTLNAKIRALK